MYYLFKITRAGFNSSYYELYANNDSEAWDKLYACLDKKSTLVSIRLMEMSVHPNLLTYKKIKEE